MDIQATDTGSGLRCRVPRQLGSRSVSGNFAGGDDCGDLTPATEAVDMSMNAKCAEVAGPRARSGHRSGMADGDYTLTVKVADWAGNVRESDAADHGAEHAGRSTPRRRP